MLETASERLQSLRVRHIMSRNVVALRAGDSMADAARRLLALGHSGGPVVDGDGLCVGWLSAYDFLRLEDVREKSESAPASEAPADILRQVPEQTDGAVADFMSTEVETVNSEEWMVHAAKRMCMQHMHHLAVLDEKRQPVGVISTLDVVAALVNALEEERLHG